MRHILTGLFMAATAVGWGMVPGAAQDQDKAADAIQQAERLAKERGELEEKLIAIVQSEKDTDASRKSAVEALGRIGTARCVPALCDLIGQTFEDRLNGQTSEGMVITSPAMTALAALGPVAVEGIVESLTKADTDEWHWGQALLMLPYKGLVRAAFIDRILREDKAEIKERFESAYVRFFGPLHWEVTLKKGEK